MLKTLDHNAVTVPCRVEMIMLLVSNLQMLAGVVLPTKMTCTEAKAAEAAKISTLRADVKRARLTENVTEKPIITASLSIRRSTK